MRWIALLMVVAIVGGCFGGPFRTPSHSERLSSGASIEVTRFMLVWGSEPDHPDDHTSSGDCLSMEYVMAAPAATPAQREAEALQAFELMRATSEQWGFRTAELAAFPSLERKGRYDF